MAAGRDVTAVSARSWPDIVFPAGGADACPQLSGPITGAASARLEWNLADKDLGPEVIAYPAADDGARELSQRLGALTGRSVRTAALADGATEFALEWQMAGAFVLPIQQQYPTGCLQMAVLLGTAPWLQRAALGSAEYTGDNLIAAETATDRNRPSAAESLVLQDLVLPLGVSRTWLIARGSLAGLRLAFDGTPLLSGLGTADDPGSAEDTP
mgnify:FL=1